MKRIYLFMAAIIICSCTKEEIKKQSEPLEESVVYISLNRGESKANGASHGVQGDDNNIGTLEFFIFRLNEGEADDGILDGYRKFTAQEIGNLENLEIQTTTGKKIIYAIANSHKSGWGGIDTRGEFEQQLANLTDDNVKDFIMTGSIEVELQLASRVTFSIKRMVSRIQLNSIKTDFAGGPYEGCSLKGVKAYLTNVQGAKYIHDGTGSNITLLNKGGYIAEDCEKCSMTGMLYDNIGVEINDNGYNTTHYFYCYENPLSQQSDTDKFTKVVIEGELNGTKYYYPIAIKELQRNSCYSLDVIIRRPGSTNPDADLEVGAILANVTVLPWNVLPGTQVEF